MLGFELSFRASQREGRYWHRVKSLFGRRRFQFGKAASSRLTDGGQAGSAVETRRQPASQGAGGRDLSALETRLRELAARPGPGTGLLAGKIQLLQLGEVQARFGTRWPKVSDRIHERVRAELDARLTPHDLYAQINDYTYVIIFEGCSEVEARLKMAILSEQILVKLLGQETAARDMAGIETVLTHVVGATASGAVQGLGALAKLLETSKVARPELTSRSFTATAAGGRALTPEAVVELLGDMDALLHTMERQPAAVSMGARHGQRMLDLIEQLKTLEESLAAGDTLIPAWQAPERGEGAAPGDGSAHDVLDQLRRLKARAGRQITAIGDHKTACEEDTPIREARLADEDVKLEFRYLPLWHAGSERLGVYLCDPKLLSPDWQEIRNNRHFSSIEYDIKAIIDRMTLRKVRQDLRKASAEGRSNVVLIPVHLSSLQRHVTRNQILEMCNNIPEETRKFIVWEILDAPAESWRRQLPESIAALRRFGRACFLRLPESVRRYPESLRSLHHVKAAGVRNIGIDIHALNWDEAEALSLLEHLVGAADGEGLKCYGLGFQSMSMTVCAICMGFEHVAGQSIAEPTSEPGGVKPVTLDAIYGRIASVAARNRAHAAAV